LSEVWSFNDFSLHHADGYGRIREEAEGEEGEG